MSITVLQDGRINMRRVDDRQAVMKLFEKMERVLIGAAVCNSCGRDLLSILLDGKLSPQEEEHVILEGGSNLDLDQTAVDKPLVRSEFSSLSVPHLDSILESVDSLIRLLWESSESLINHHSTEFDVDALVIETRQRITDVLSDSPSPYPAAVSM